jgi:hypothetical protein
MALLVFHSVLSLRSAVRILEKSLEVVSCQGFVLALSEEAGGEEQQTGISFEGVVWNLTIFTAVATMIHGSPNSSKSSLYLTLSKFSCHVSS